MSRALATFAGGEAYVALWHGALADAEGAGQREESEALHDFRVAVRRLRVAAGHYGEASARQQKVLRRLKRLTAMTNAGRDSEVMLAWLEQQWPQLRVEERRGARYWRRELKRAAREAPTMARLLRRLQPVATQLASLPVSKEIAAVAFGCVVAQQLQRESGRLLCLLQESEALSQLHRLRLQAKRVRYLLAPFGDEVEACGEAELQLQQLQDLLGGWHDSVICQQSLHRLVATRMMALQRDTTRSLRHGAWPDVATLAPALAGLLTLQRLNLQRQQAVSAAMVRDYLADGATVLEEALQRAAAALCEQAAMGEPDRLP